MKATIDIPDDLYRRVKARCALDGRPVRDITIDLFRGWLHDGAPAAGRDAPATTDGARPSWFAGARATARRVRSHDMEAVRASIARGRAAEGGTP